MYPTRTEELMAIIKSGNSGELESLTITPVLAKRILEEVPFEFYTTQSMRSIFKFLNVGK